MPERRIVSAKIDQDLIRDTITRFNRRVEAIKLVGGISMVEEMEGKPIPAGWVLDVECCWYVPPGFTVSDTDH